MDEISDGIESGLNEAFDESFDAKGEMVKQYDVPVLKNSRRRCFGQGLKKATFSK